MKGLILIFVLLSGISSAIAQEKLWLDKNYQWTDDSIQAVRYALVSKINKKCIKVEEYAWKDKRRMSGISPNTKAIPAKDKGRPAYIILCKWQGQPDRSI